MNRDFKLGAFYCDLGIDGQYDWKLKVCYLGHVVFFQTFIWFEGDWLEVSCIVHSPLIWFGGGIELRNDDLKKEVLDIPSSLSSLEELRRDDLKKEAPDSDEGLVELALRKYSYLYIFFSGTQIAYDFKKLKWVEYVAEDHYSLERRYNDVQKNVK